MPIHASGSVQLLFCKCHGHGQRGDFIAGARTMVITTKIKELQYYTKFNEIFVLSLADSGDELSAGNCSWDMAEISRRKEKKTKGEENQKYESKENGSVDDLQRQLLAGTFVYGRMRYRRKFFSGDRYHLFQCG